MTVKEVAERTVRAIGTPDIEPEITGKYRAGDIRHCFADISLAQAGAGLGAAGDAGTGSGRSGRLADGPDGGGSRHGSAGGTGGPGTDGMKRASEVGKSRGHR